MAYRTGRNIIASVIDNIESLLQSNGWNGVSVVKGFAQAYETELPVICVRINTTEHNPIEVGSSLTVREPNLILDVFATSFGQAEDLKDFLVDELKAGMTYYTYTTVNGTVTGTSAGRLRVFSIKDYPVNFGSELTKIDKYDRYRWVVSMKVSTGQTE